MSLTDPSKKMSKSEPSDYSRINLTDDADTIAQKIRKAKTDPEALPSEEKGLEPRPGSTKEFADFIKSDMAKWSKVVKSANIKLDQ